MKHIFRSLTEQIYSDPNMTAEKTEQEIADTIGKNIKPILDGIASSKDTQQLRDAIRKKFGLLCEIAPAISVYVNISQMIEDRTIPEFSSQPFGQRIREINRKDFSALSREVTLKFIEQAINEACMNFLASVILPHPELKKVFDRFVETFNLPIGIAAQAPVILLFRETPSCGTSAETQRPGQYL